MTAAAAPNRLWSDSKGAYSGMESEAEDVPEAETLRPNATDHVNRAVSARLPDDESRRNSRPLTSE